MFGRTVIVDCGASRTSIGVFRARRRGLCLEFYTTHVFASDSNPSVGHDASIWLQRTAAALKSLRERMPRRAGPVTLVLPPHLALIKPLKCPPVAAAKREKIIRFEAEQALPHALDEMVWDRVATGEHRGELQVLLSAAKLSELAPLCAAVAAAGFAVETILPAPLATLAAFRLRHVGANGQSGSALTINLGARSTVLLFSEGHRFYLRTLLLGSGGASVSRFAVEADASDGFAMRLAQEISRSVLHFKNQHDLAPPQHIHLTGGGARQGALAESLGARFKIPVSSLDVTAQLEIGTSVVRSQVMEDAHILTDLVGAAAARIRASQFTLNLLPPAERLASERRGRLPWFAVAAALGVIAWVPPLWQSFRYTDAVQAKTSALENELGPLRARDARNRAALRQIESAQVEIAQLRGIADRRTSWAGLFADLQARLTDVEDVWLETLKVLPPSDTHGAVRLHFSGRMLDRANPEATVSAETTARVRTLFASLVDSPRALAVESERFDPTQPGILKFDFVLVVDGQHPL